MTRSNQVFMLMLSLLSKFGIAQTKTEFQTSKLLFAGEWLEKRTGRHLRITFIEEWKLAEISDWRGNYYSSKAMIDMYKARIGRAKLVMAEGKSDLRSPYAELIRSGSKLVYRWKLYTRANGAFVDSAIFIRHR